MAAWNRVTLRERILQHLGVVGAGQVPSSEDAEIVDEAIDIAFAKLRKMNLAPFAVDAVPEWAQDSMRDYVSYMVAGTFGVGPQKTAQLYQEQQLALASLRLQVASSLSAEPVRTWYY